MHHARPCVTWCWCGVHLKASRPSWDCWTQFPDTGTAPGPSVPSAVSLASLPKCCGCSDSSYVTVQCGSHDKVLIWALSTHICSDNLTFVVSIPLVRQQTTVYRQTASRFSNDIFYLCQIKNNNNKTEKHTHTNVTDYHFCGCKRQLYSCPDKIVCY